MQQTGSQYITQHSAEMPSTDEKQATSAHTHLEGHLCDDVSCFSHGLLLRVSIPFCHWRQDTPVGHPTLGAGPLL